MSWNRPDLPDNAPTQEVEQIAWINYLTDPMVGVDGQDASLAGYLAESGSRQDLYEYDSGSLRDSYGDVREVFTTEIAERANVQGGGYGVPGARVGPGRGSGGFPLWLLVAAGLWWFYK